MSNQLESKHRIVERKLVIAPVYPRVQVWTPLNFEDAIADMAAMDSSIIKLFRPSNPTFQLPDTSIHGISDIYSDAVVTGISNRELMGSAAATYVLFKGNLLVPFYSHPAEMRYALLQTVHSKETVKSTLAKARIKLSEENEPSRSPRYFKEG